MFKVSKRTLLLIAGIVWLPPAETLPGWASRRSLKST